MRIDKKIVLIKETCAFDSLIHLIMHSIGKECRYKENIQHLDHPTIKLALNIINRGKLLMADYMTRAKILLNTNICQESRTRHVTLMNANCNVSHLVDILFHELPTVTQLTTCNTCHTVQTRHFSTLYVNIGMLIEKGLGTVQEAIDDTQINTECTTKCKQCNNNIIRTYEYGPHILIDTSLLTDPNYKSQIYTESTLESIKKSINLDNRQYKLCGIINYTSYASSKNSNQGHYVTYEFTGINWHEYDDFKKARCYISSQKTVTPHIIMYTCVQ